MDSATSWFSRNLSIAGFTETLAAFTTSRELIENAVDASRSCIHKSIHIALDLLTPSLLRICVSDRGCGLSAETVDSFTCLFSTSADSMATFGHFGIGLKLAALSSFNCGHPLRISSRGISFYLLPVSVELAASEDLEGFHTRVLAVAPFEAASFVPLFTEYIQDLRDNLSQFSITLEATPVVESQSTIHRDLCVTAGDIVCDAAVTDNPSIVFEVKRSLNGIPLVASLDCHIVQGVITALKQSEHALGLRIAPATTQGMTVIVPATRPNEDTGVKLMLRVQYKSEILQEWKDLTKTAITTDGVMQKVSAAVVKMLVKLKRIKAGRLFRSDDETKEKMKNDIWIPALREGLINILIRRHGLRTEVEKLLAGECLDEEGIKSKLRHLVDTAHSVPGRRRKRP